jgi:hypothetical protein
MESVQFSYAPLDTIFFRNCDLMRVLILSNMITQELKAYIREQLDAGVAKDAVKNTLSISGWSAQDVDDAFVAVESKAPAGPVTPITTVTPARMPVQNLMQPAPSRSHTGMWIIAIAILLLVVAGGVFAAGYFGLIALPFLSSTASSTPVTMVTTVSSTTTAPVVVPPIIISPAQSPLPAVSGASTTTSTTTITTTTSTTTSSSSKSEIEKYGTDLFKLKQGVTTVSKSVPSKVTIVYTKTGNTVSSVAKASDGTVLGTGGGSGQGTDEYGTDFATLKQGVTVVEKTITTNLVVTYTRTIDKIERMATETTAAGTSSVTATITLNAKDQLPAMIATIEKGLATDCVNTVTAECTAGRKILDYLRVNCLKLTTDEAVSSCEFAGALSAVLSTN